MARTFNTKRAAWLLAILSMAMLLVTPGFANSHLLPPFTQDELDNGWEADREFPTGGVKSVSAFGRENVARIGIDGDETHSNTFRRTEGIKTTPVQDFGTAVQVDLHVDPDWENKAVRAGFWVVGDDGVGARDNLFGIIEFVHLEISVSGISEQGAHEGWRIWDSAIGWVPLTTDFTYGEWATLRIELDTQAEQYNYYINGELVGSASGGEHFIRELFLNSYNYGLDGFPTLSNDSYAAHWHNGSVPVTGVPDTGAAAPQYQSNLPWYLGFLGVLGAVIAGGFGLRYLRHSQGSVR